MVDYQESISGYKERIGRISLFDIFSQAKNKNKKDNLGNNIDYHGMMLLTLLFFFECMLTRTYISGVNELSAYLKEMTEKHYTLNDSDYLEIAKQMIGILRPSGGKRNRKEFMNFESGKKDYVEISYLKVKGWDKEKNHQYYILDEQGLELIFASKEYYNEFQISISQLILRKQLEKGEFGGALRQIDEMRISVHGIRDKIITIKHEIQSNIVSDEVYDRYKALIEDINTRLQREHEEFQELAGFVKDTQKYYERDMNHSNKDLRAYEAIIRVDNELNDVHNLHSKLLDESIELKTKTLKAARESMYFVGLTSFNFKSEIVGKMMNDPIPFMETKLMAKPFLRMGKAKVWTPIALFAKQRVLKKDHEIKFDEFLEYASVQNRKELEERKIIYKIVFSNIYKEILEGKKVKLSELRRKINPELVEMKEVYEMMILMHQLSPIDVDLVKDQKEHIFSEAMGLIKKRKQIIQILEVKDDIVDADKIQISDMTLFLSHKDEIKQ